MIVVFSGSSGVGKNTVINELLNQNVNLTLMPTCTTRAMRLGEVEGKPYFFISVDEFKSMIQADQFYEYEVVHEVNYYGTPKNIVDTMVKDNRVCLKDIDVLGSMNLREVLKDTLKVLTIYLDIDRDTLVDRLNGRGEVDIERRLERYDFEKSFAPRYDYIITNVTLEETTMFCQNIIALEGRGVTPVMGANLPPLDEEKVAAYITQLEAGEILQPISVTISSDSITIVEGAERYKAALLSGKTIAKKVTHIQ